MTRQTHSAGARLRIGISLLLVICTLTLSIPAGLASVGSSSSAVVDSTAMSFVLLSNDTEIFKAETNPSSGAVTVAGGTWLMLASTDTYTSGGAEYGCIYYNNIRYNVLWSDVVGDVQSTTSVETYITGTLWTTSDYPSLKPEYNLKRDVRVYGLQMALRTLGYYSGALDGSYGDVTVAAVKKFQKAYKLDADGYAGPYTQKVLYPLAIASFSSSGTTTGTQAGTVTSSVSINLRKSYSTKSARLAVVPKSTTLAYTKTVTSSGVIWYYVTYNNISGWLMGTYVSPDGTTTGGSTSETSLGTVTANTNTVVRKTANGTRTGYLLSKNSTATLLAAAVTSGSYSWYYIKLSNGVKGYVRGDCVSATFDAGTGLTPSTTKEYIKVSDAGITIFTTEEAPSSGGTKVSSGTVLQLVSTDTYTKNNV